MQPRRVIPANVVLGESITRFHIDMENPMMPDHTTEFHIAHHENGDLAADADWYGIYEHPTEWQYQLARKALNIDEEDWKIVEHMLGSYRWVVYHHAKPPLRSEIRVDVPAMQAGEWTTTYF